MRLQLFPKMIRAVRDGRLGDAGALKAALLGAPAYPQIGEALRRMAVPFPSIDVPALGALAAGTFGRAYADFMRAHRLTALRLSGEVEADLVPDDILAVRYLLLHDAFHVLLGFDVSPAGELGVWTFVGAQHYSPSFERAATVARLFYTVTHPQAAGALRQARLRGRELARSAPCLIAQPIEQWWGEPMPQLRERLGMRGFADFGAGPGQRHDAAG